MRWLEPRAVPPISRLGKLRDTSSHICHLHFDFCAPCAVHVCICVCPPSTFRATAPGHTGGFSRFTAPAPLHRSITPILHLLASRTHHIKPVIRSCLISPPQKFPSLSSSAISNGLDLSASRHLKNKYLVIFLLVRLGIVGHHRADAHVCYPFQQTRPF
jgi:hypothetical protein